VLILLTPITAKPSSNPRERCIRVKSARQKYDKEEEGVETIVSLNTELEVAIPYPQLQQLTATTVAERQRPSLPEPLDLNIGKEYRQLSIRLD
jgi:hypothetical protein